MGKWEIYFSWVRCIFDVHKNMYLAAKTDMSARIVKKDGGKITIEVDMELDGDMLSQEEAIQIALNEAGKLATLAAYAGFDTDGRPIERSGERMTSKGEKKK
jgi:hypothetical protein